MAVHAVKSCIATLWESSQPFLPETNVYNFKKHDFDYLLSSLPVPYLDLYKVQELRGNVINMGWGSSTNHMFFFSVTVLQADETL